MIKTCMYNIDDKMYNVYFDDLNTLYQLIDRLIREGSYQERGIYNIRDYDKSDLLAFTHFKDHDMCVPYLTKPFLLNGQPEYIHATKIGDFGDAIQIAATKIVVPGLAHAIYELMNAYPNALKNLLDYEDWAELVPLDEQIKTVYNVAEEANMDDQLDYKIGMLKHLKRLREDKQQGCFFNVEFLKEIYEELCNAVFIREVDVISVKTGTEYPEIGDMISLKEFIKSRKEKSLD